MPGAVSDSGATWQAQLLRLSVFLAAPLPADEVEHIWLNATGELPTIDENRPREGVRRYAGPFDKGQLDIQISAPRVDWIMAPTFDPRSGMLPLAAFTDVESGLATFGGIARRWLQTAPISASRIALGAILVLPVASQRVAYEHLQGILKRVTVDPVNASDLFYQINWPRESNVVTGVRINRLTKWQAIVRHTVEFQLSSSPALQAPAAEEHYCWLECDHNTARELVEPFTGSELVALFNELTELALDNAMNGEIPAQSSQA